MMTLEILVILLAVAGSGFLGTMVWLYLHPPDVYDNVARRRSRTKHS